MLEINQCHKQLLYNSEFSVVIQYCLYVKATAL